MILSCGTAIVTEAFPDEERGKGLGILGISVSFGLVTGPMIGGVLLRWLDWRSIYYIRSPVGFMALLLALTVLKKDMVKTGKINLDLMGALTSSAGLACLVFSISQISRLGFGSSLIQLLISVSILCLIAFIFIEQRTTAPIVDFSLFKNRTFSFSICGLFLIFVSYPAYFLIMPFYLIQGLGMTASTAGLLMALPYTVGIILSPISGSLSDRFGPFWFVSLGAVSIIASFLLMRGFDLRTQIMTLIPACLLFGACDGLFQAPNNSTIMGNTPKDRYGMASAIMALLRQMGMSLGMALISAVYSARIDVHQEELSRQGLENTLISRLSITLAFHDVLIVSLIIASIVLLISFPLKRYSPLRRNR
jgi:EmrB/QacA subfamily drug resistance transporter